MNTRIRVMLAAVALTMGLSGCTIGSRRMVSDTRELDDFDEISFDGVGELTIEQGRHNEIEIDAESNVMRRIQTYVRGDTLHIDMRGGLLGNIAPTRAIRYHLTVADDISVLELSGVGSIYMDELETDALSVNVSGAGKVEIDSLEADSLRVEHSGVGQCKLSGEVDRQRVLQSGAGEYDAGDLESATADVQLSGVGSATVWATESLDVEISGAGSIRYYGRPDVDQNVSGVGSVKSLGRH